MNLVVLFLVDIDVYVRWTRQLLSARIQQPSSVTFPHLVDSALSIEWWRGRGLVPHQWWLNHWLLCTFTGVIIEENHWLHLRLRCLNLFIRHYKEWFLVDIVGFGASTSDMLGRSVTHWWYLFYVDTLNQIGCRSHSKTVHNMSPLCTFVRGCGFLLN